MFFFSDSCTTRQSFPYRLPSVDGHKENDHVAHEIQPEYEFNNTALDSEQIHLNDVQSFDDVPDTGQTVGKSNPQPSSSVLNEMKKPVFPSSNTAVTLSTHHKCNFY